MKSFSRSWWWTALAVVAGVALVVQAADDDRPAGGRRARERAVAPEAEADGVAYLGITVEPIPEVMRGHVDLPAGAGVVVTEVDPEGAAVGVLNLNDVLFKVDDQVIVNLEQLVVVVRMHKPGDEVTLTYIRRGGKQEKARVKLLSRKAPPPEAVPMPGWPRTPRMPRMPDFPELPAPVPPAPRMQDPRDRAPVRPDRNIRLHSNVQFHVSKATGEGRFSYEMKNGRKTFRAESPDGKVLFDGPVNTREERAQVPDKLRSTLEEMEQDLPDVRIFNRDAQEDETKPADPSIELDPDSPPARPI